MPITASDISMQIYPVRSLLILLLLFFCFFLWLCYIKWSVRKVVTVAADEIRNNHLGAYKQPYDPCFLCDCRGVLQSACMPNWLNNVGSRHITPKLQRHWPKRLFRILSATNVPVFKCCLMWSYSTGGLLSHVYLI